MQLLLELLKGLYGRSAANLPKDVLVQVRSALGAGFDAWWDSRLPNDRLRLIQIIDAADIDDEEAQKLFNVRSVVRDREIGEPTTLEQFVIAMVSRERRQRSGERPDCEDIAARFKVDPKTVRNLASRIRTAAGRSAGSPTMSSRHLSIDLLERAFWADPKITPIHEQIFYDFIVEKVGGRGRAAYSAVAAKHHRKTKTIRNIVGQMWTREALADDRQECRVPK